MVASIIVCGTLLVLLLLALWRATQLNVPYNDKHWKIVDWLLGGYFVSFLVMYGFLLYHYLWHTIIGTIVLGVVLAVLLYWLFFNSKSPAEEGLDSFT